MDPVQVGMSQEGQQPQQVPGQMMVQMLPGAQYPMQTQSQQQVKLSTFSFLGKKSC